MEACCGNDPGSDQSGDCKENKKDFFKNYREYGPAIVSSLLLLTGIIIKELVEPAWFTRPFQLVLFGLAYLPVGGPVLLKAIRQIRKGDIFNEFFLMGIATIGAFFLGEYAEGVAVMLFYAVGELFQGAAVKRARQSIEGLLEVQVEQVGVVQKDQTIKVMHPSQVGVGSIIQVRPGEKVALDGELVSERATYNTAALTGEAAPDRKYKGETVLAGMINLENLSTIRVTSRFEDSKLSQVLKMVQEAAARKARTQRFITRFAKVYTPIVVLLGTTLTFLPFFILENYIFEEWLYRALVFLVISCPCALLISIPLGYFGGIGAASRNGILFKGSNYLDQMRKVETVVMDKTGTLTKGIFKVQKVKSVGLDENLLLSLTSSLERYSTHPIAKAVTVHCETLHCESFPVSEVEELAGLGMKGEVGSFSVLAGNSSLLKKFGITYDEEVDEIDETVVVVAVNGEYSGFITIADELREDASLAVKELRRAGIKNLVMLSGDKDKVVQKIGRQLGLDLVIGELLPEGKIKAVASLKQKAGSLVFIGDGLNDAPVITLADIGVAMGGLGSDATIETADVVIQTDQPSKIVTAIEISKATHKIVWQNISLALGVKLLVLGLGALGMASMWEAVFADVGVAILAILNAMRIQRKEFHLEPLENPQQKRAGKERMSGQPLAECPTETDESQKVS